jgi:hypothetical protein
VKVASTENGIIFGNIGKNHLAPPSMVNYNLRARLQLESTLSNGYLSVIFCYMHGITQIQVFIN